MKKDLRKTNKVLAAVIILTMVFGMFAGMTAVKAVDPPSTKDVFIDDGIAERVYSAGGDRNLKLVTEENKFYQLDPIRTFNLKALPNGKGDKVLYTDTGIWQQLALKFTGNRFTAYASNLTDKGSSNVAWEYEIFEVKDNGDIVRVNLPGQTGRMNAWCYVAYAWGLCDEDNWNGGNPGMFKTPLLDYGTYIIEITVDSAPEGNFFIGGQVYAAPVDYEAELQSALINAKADEISRDDALLKYSRYSYLKYKTAFDKAVKAAEEALASNSNSVLKKGLSDFKSALAKVNTLLEPIGDQINLLVNSENRASYANFTGDTWWNINKVQNKNEFYINGGPDNINTVDIPGEDVEYFIFHNPTGETPQPMGLSFKFTGTKFAFLVSDILTYPEVVTRFRIRMYKASEAPFNADIEQIIDAKKHLDINLCAGNPVFFKDAAAEAGDLGIGWESPELPNDTYIVVLGIINVPFIGVQITNVKSPMQRNLEEAIADALEGQVTDPAGIYPKNFEDYTKAYEKAIADAETKFGSEIAQRDINAFNAEIATAEALLGRSIKEILGEAIVAAEAKRLSDAEKALYTKQSVNDYTTVLEDAITKANHAYNDSASTNAKYEKAIEDLGKALHGIEDKLIEKPDTSDLEAAIAEAESFEEDQYTASSWAVFKAALDEAKAALTSEDEERIDEAEGALRSAIRALSKKPVNPTDPTDSTDSTQPTDPTNPTQPDTQIEAEFGDLDRNAKPGDPKHHWAQEWIFELADAGVINGFDDGTFKPDALITRAQYVQMLTKAFKIYDENEKCPEFTDVAENDWFRAAVASAKNKGITQGKTATTFEPAANMTRQEMMTLTARTLNILKGYEFPAEDKIEGLLEKFADKGDIAGIKDFKEAIALNVALKIVEGSKLDNGDWMLYPGADIKRGEVAKILSIAIKK